MLPRAEWGTPGCPTPSPIPAAVAEPRGRAGEDRSSRGLLPPRLPRHHNFSIPGPKPGSVRRASALLAACPGPRAALQGRPRRLPPLAPSERAARRREGTGQGQGPRRGQRPADPSTARHAHHPAAARRLPGSGERGAGSSTGRKGTPPPRDGGAPRPVPQALAPADPARPPALTGRSRPGATHRSRAGGSSPSPGRARPPAAPQPCPPLVARD